MEVLRQNKVMWRMCGIYSEDEAPFASNLCAYVTNLLVILIVASHTVMSAAFIVYADKTTQIEQIMYAVLQCASGSAAFSVYLTLLSRNRGAVQLTSAIQTLVNQRASGNAKIDAQNLKVRFVCSAGYRFNRSVYVSVERSAFLLAKWPPILLSSTFVMSLTMGMVGCLAHDFYIGAIDVSKWYKLYMLQTPYDRQTIRGYAISYIDETVTVTCLAINFAINLSIFIGPILYLRAFCADLLNTLTQWTDVRRPSSVNRNTVDAQVIGEFVEFHKYIVE